MANQANRLAPKKAESKPLEVTYQANGKSIRLTPGMVKKYLISGNPDAVTDQEIMMLLDGDTLLGGWAKVYRKDRSHPSVSECSLNEYIGRKKDGSINGQWGGKPATMIRKVALVQALREAFPARLGAMYTSEERGVEEPVEAPFTEIPDETVDAPQGTHRLQEPRPAVTAVSKPDPQGAELPPPPVDDDFFAGSGM